MKSILFPTSLLALILILSLLNGVFVDRAVNRWDTILSQAEDSASAGDWDSAREAMHTFQEQWDAYQTYLHIVERHEELDDAQTLFLRTAVLAQQEELTTFLTEIQDLRAQLSLLLEMEQLTVKNVLTYFPAAY